MMIAMALAILVAFTCRADMRMIPALGDARMGTVTVTNDMEQIKFLVKLPDGAYEGATVTSWFRVTRWNNSQLTTIAEWCPEDVQRTNVDLLAGAGGYGGGTAIDLDAADGVVVFADVVLAGYTNAPASVSNRWPYGACTVAGESTDIITVSVGGEDLLVGPGEFNRNLIAGPSGAVVVSGTGEVHIGVSQTPCYQFFAEINGVGDMDGLSAESIVTNEFVMCVWRWRCEDECQIYRSDIGRIAFNVLSQIKTNAPCAALHSGGQYIVGLGGFRLVPPFDFEMFDPRVFSRWLTDAELERVHINGMQELMRRGLID